MNQERLDYIASTLDVKYKVLDNLSDGKKSYKARITLTNTGATPFSKDDKWKIYLCHIRKIQPTDTGPDEQTITLKKFGVQFNHINGCLFCLEPLDNFKTLNEGESLDVLIKADYYSVARSDLMPNWYICNGDLNPKIIASTANENLDYVEPFDTPKAWKRFDYKLDNGTKRYDM